MPNQNTALSWERPTEVHRHFIYTHKTYKYNKHVRKTHTRINSSDQSRAATTQAHSVSAFISLYTSLWWTAAHLTSNEIFSRLLTPISIKYNWSQPITELWLTTCHRRVSVERDKQNRTPNCLHGPVPVKVRVPLRWDVLWWLRWGRGGRESIEGESSQG